MKYSKEHVWVKEEGNIVTVGISDYAQKQISDVAYVQLPEIGGNAVKGKGFATIESVKSVSDVFAPVSGEIVEVNNRLSDEPELINKDPAGGGWIAKIKVKDKAELNSLMSERAYQDFVKG